MDKRGLGKYLLHLPHSHRAVPLRRRIVSHWPALVCTPVALHYRDKKCAAAVVQTYAALDRGEKCSACNGAWAAAFFEDHCPLATVDGDKQRASVDV
jgi:hypothetical protein